MKKRNVLLGILIGLTILSCTDDVKEDQELSMSELLIQNSPWTFSHYEMTRIIEAGNSNFSRPYIENIINQSNAGSVITFKENGTGSLYIPNDGTENWQWEIVNTNQLKMTFDGVDTEIFENISISSSQFVIEIESTIFDEEAFFEVLHKGKFIYE